MRTFKGFPPVAVCPICGTSKQGKCVLIPVEGTGDVSDKKFQNFESRPTHLDCLDLWLIQDETIIFQKIPK